MLAGPCAHGARRRGRDKPREALGVAIVVLTRVATAASCLEVCPVSYESRRRAAKAAPEWPSISRSAFLPPRTRAPCPPRAPPRGISSVGLPRLRSWPALRSRKAAGLGLLKVSHMIYLRKDLLTLISTKTTPPQDSVQAARATVGTYPLRYRWHRRGGSRRAAGRWPPSPVRRASPGQP